MDAMEWKLPVLVAAAVGSGVMAGIFFIFSNTIMAALGRMPPAQGMAAMNHINVVIVNPLFVTFFLGTGVLSLAVGVPALLHLAEPGALCALLAAAIYIAGCLGVTRLLNIPLNDALVAAGASGGDASALWADYLSRWTLYNHIRSVATLVSTVLFVLAARRA